MKDFRLLNPDEIEVRVSHTSKDYKKAMLLLYKDARCDMKILDETLGITGWQRSHEVINGQLFCNVSIYDEDKKQWITKQDVGVESFSEAEKGRASDAFKRACFNIGIGRELYTAPTIWVEDISGQNTKDAWKWKTYRVKEVGYDENRKIDSLVIEEYYKFKWQEVFRFLKKGYTKTNSSYRKNNNLDKNQARYKQDNKQEVMHMFDIAEEVGIKPAEIAEKMMVDFKKSKTTDLTSDEIKQLVAWISQISFEESN